MWSLRKLSSTLAFAVAVVTASPAPDSTHLAPRSVPTGVFYGDATFFYQEGLAGACGSVHADSDFIVAIPPDLFGRSYPSPLCGTTVTITDRSNGKQTSALVADECPTCVNATSLDLSVGVFTYFAGSINVGLFLIEWEFVQ